MSLTGFGNPLKLCATFLSKRPGIFLLWRNARSRWGTLNLDEGRVPMCPPYNLSIALWSPYNF